MCTQTRSRPSACTRTSRHTAACTSSSRQGTPHTQWFHRHRHQPLTETQDLHGTTRGTGKKNQKCTEHTNTKDKRASQLHTNTNRENTA